MMKFLTGASVFAAAAVLAGPALAGNWSVAIEQNPATTNCGRATNIPVAGANSCSTAETAAQNLLKTLLNTPDCMSYGCKLGETAQMAKPTCVPNQFTRPNGDAATRWQIGIAWTCVAASPAGTPSGSPRVVDEDGKDCTGPRCPKGGKGQERPLVIVEVTPQTAAQLKASVCSLSATPCYVEKKDVELRVVTIHSPPETRQETAVLIRLRNGDICIGSLGACGSLSSGEKPTSKHIPESSMYINIR